MRTYNNRILNVLDRETRLLIEPRLEKSTLPAGTVLVEYQTTIDHIYFIESGLASSVTASAQGHAVETLIVGCEGFTGIPLVLATDRTAAKVFVQIAGDAWRLKASDVRDTMRQSVVFRDALLGYVHSAFDQMAHTALSNSAHRVDQRLARRLLMAHDRIEGDTVALTHRALASALNVRRSSVTDALHVVEGMGLIRSLRSRIVILDRAGLERLACDAYGAAEAMPPSPGRSVRRAV